MIIATKKAPKREIVSSTSLHHNHDDILGRIQYNSDYRASEGEPGRPEDRGPG